jgi:glycosyltransferase involved in cell wall biosynthesis
VIRVVCVINELDVGGAERLLADQINHSPDIEFHVCLLTAARSVLAAQLPPDVDVRDLGAANRWDPRPIMRLRSALDDIQPDVVHAHLPRSGAVAALATRGSGRPMVYTEHSIWPAYRPITRRLAVVAARTAAIVVAVSEAVRRSCQQHAGIPDERIRTIHNGVALDRLGSAVPTQATNGLRLCAVGSLLPIKGYPHLLHALAALAGEVDVSLDVFGAGPDLGELTFLAWQLRLSDSVRFRGQSANAASELVAYDAFCLPSLIEGLPMALIEAMGTGLPVVASAVGGIPEVIVDGDNGLLVAPADPAALAAALRSLARDPDLRARMGANARRTVRDQLSIERSVAAYTSVYRELS